ncbi:GNAT family N-acetyltransferase [Aliikangiella coralliicola]|uniref:GNAT family N-acetyltransferase n=1 Tax=Aliikangiella coralliicola TaxID=2592383 RepID=A0A545UI85_9GAMM|nr:GNAT family N-acetyltransferase [Aliikangiella coralliicola]TQV89175.1 GNAT family N-acetyltransferase [Aliikangiella coralliicola]
MKVRRATIQDLDSLVTFTAQEAEQAEGSIRAPETLRRGIKAALEDPDKGIYWVLVDASDSPVGSISAITEWSDWNAGYYWWIQSLFITPACRGRGLINHLLDAVKQEMSRQGGLELRLYVHKDNHAAIRAYEKVQFELSNYLIMIDKS